MLSGSSDVKRNFLRYTSMIALRSFSSGNPQYTDLSILPGRKSATSTKSGREDAAITNIPSLPSTPSR